MGLVADAMLKAEAKRNAEDSMDRVLEDAHDTFRWDASAKYGVRAHAYIDAYRLESKRTPDGTAVLSVVNDLIRRAYELGGGSKGACQGADGAELAELRESMDGLETENDVLRFTLAKLRQGMEDAVDAINDTLGEEE